MVVENDEWLETFRCEMIGGTVFDGRIVVFFWVDFNVKPETRRMELQQGRWVQSASAMVNMSAVHVGTELVKLVCGFNHFLLSFLSFLLTGGSITSHDNGWINKNQLDRHLYSDQHFDDIVTSSITSEYLWFMMISCSLAMDLCWRSLPYGQCFCRVGSSTFHWERLHIESTNFGEMKRQATLHPPGRRNIGAMGW